MINREHAQIISDSAVFDQRILAISIINIFFLFIIGLIYKIFVFSPILDLTDPTASLNSHSRIFFHLIRSTISALSILFADSNFSPMLRIALFIIALSNYYRLLLTATAVYHHKTRLSILIIIIIGILICAFSAIKFICQTEIYDLEITIGILVCGAGMIILVCFFHQETYPELIHFVDQKEDSVISALYAMLLLYYNYLKNPSKYNHFLLVAYFSKHYSECTFPFCPITIYMLSHAQFNPKTDKDSILNALLHSVNRILKKLIIMHPNLIQCKILYLAFLVKFMPWNCILAYEIYKIILNEKINPIESSMLISLKWYLNNNLQNRIKHGEANFNDSYVMIKKMKHEQKFKNLLIENAMQYLQFWDLLQEYKPAYKKFYSCATQILEGNSKIKKLWKELRNSSIDTSLQFLYDKYLTEVKFDQTGVNDQEIMRNNGFYDISLLKIENGDCIISVSVKSVSTGKIIKVSPEFCRISGYTNEELIDNNVEKIIPSVFRETHKNAFINECYLCESGIYNYHDYSEKFLLHKSGYIIAVNMQVLICPSMINSYCMIGKIKVQHKNADSHNIVYLICDTNGKIIEISSSIFLRFDNNF